jgi:hypothetical protein
MKGWKSALHMRRILAVALACGLTSTVASADIYVTGTLCTEGLGFVGDVLNYNGGFATNPGSVEVYSVCAIPTDQNLGLTHSFELRVEDNHATQNFSSFLGLVIGTNGEILSSSGSGSTSGTGEFTMSFNATTGATSDDYSYVVLGNIPGNSSQIENLRIM